MRTIRATAAVTAVLIYALIVLGALVRTTDSGLACPDWPTCYGHWIPLPADVATMPNIGYTYVQVMLEWVHRLIAGVLRRGARPDLARAGGLLLLLLLVQGALGGVTVLDRNSPWSVALHLGNALLVLTVTLRILAGALRWSGAAASRPLVAPAAVAWCLALVAMMSAAMTAKSGASLACATWPSCNGALVPDLGDPYVRIHFAHRVLAALTALALVWLYWRGRAAPPPLRRLVTAALLLVLVQIGLGALVIVLEVPVWKAVLHQAVGVLTFATVTLVLWRCIPAPLTARLGDPNGLALRGA